MRGDNYYDTSSGRLPMKEKAFVSISLSNSLHSQSQTNAPLIDNPGSQIRDFLLTTYFDQHILKLLYDLT